MNNEKARKNILSDVKNDENVFIVITGGYDKFKISKEMNIINIEINHNSIDFTGIISLIEILDDYTGEYREFFNFDNFMYLHDTCKMGPNFLDIINDLKLIENESYSFEFPSSNLGIYSTKFIMSIKDKILELKNISNEFSDLQHYKHLGVPMEDFIFKKNSQHKFLNFETTISEPKDIYTHGIERIVIYYKHYDLYKYKANWSYKVDYELNN